MFGWRKKHPQPLPALPEWRADWLYALILRTAEQNWEWCDRDRDVWRYVLVEEWSSADGSMCRGEVVRSWVRDAEGLREITPSEHRRHKRQLCKRGLFGRYPHRRIFPFVLVSFHIHPDRQRVVLGLRQATTAGGGSRYLVDGAGEAATLEPDPEGGFWRS